MWRSRSLRRLLGWRLGCSGGTGILPLTRHSPEVEPHEALELLAREVERLDQERRRTKSLVFPEPLELRTSGFEFVLSRRPEHMFVPARKAQILGTIAPCSPGSRISVKALRPRREFVSILNVVKGAGVLGLAVVGAPVGAVMLSAGLVQLERMSRATERELLALVARLYLPLETASASPFRS